ncbi:MAG: glycoside hydrolase family 13 protein, partial [Planctomyces sp.]
MQSSTPSWVSDAIFYQIFPDRFARSGRVNTNLNLEDWNSPPTSYGFKGGDLYGVAEHLDELSDLGVTALYLNPIFASACNHRYHTYDYFQVDPLLGGNDAFRFLLSEAHHRGIRIVLDGVFNHASRGFWQFHHVLENGAASPYRDWFYFDPERMNGQRPFLPYPDADAAEELRRGRGSLEAIGYSAWWNLPALPKFNVATPAVREFLLTVAEHWIRFGIDGWRLDVPNEIDDDDFWRDFRRRVRAINPEAWIVGEVWGDARHWLQGDMWDAVMNYQVTAACLAFFGGAGLDFEETRRPSSFGNIRPIDAGEFAAELDRIERSYPEEVTRSQLNLLDSHDMPRFLTCVRNDKAALRMAWLLLCTLPGAPCIYYGDEIGLDGRHDPDCRKAYPQEPSIRDEELRQWYRECIQLRKRCKSLRHGARRTLLASADICV